MTAHKPRRFSPAHNRAGFRQRKLARRQQQILEDNMATQCTANTAAGTRCRNMTNNPNGLCVTHRQVRPTPRRSPRRTNPAPVPVRQNNDPTMIYGLIALIFVALVAGLIWALFFRPAREVRVVKTQTVVETPMPEVSASPAPEQPGMACQAWVAGETRDLLPGQTALGDVRVNGEIRYDNGSDEGTIVVNLSSSPVEIFAEWGAGCLVVTDLNKLVTNELFNTGCGPSQPCSRVRAVLVTDGGGVSETFYTEPLH